MNQTLYSLLTLYINQYYKFQIICSLKQGIKIDCCSSFKDVAVIKYPYKKHIGAAVFIGLQFQEITCHSEEVKTGTSNF